MISQRIVRMVEDNAHELCQNWLRTVRRSQKMGSYHALDDGSLYQRSLAIFLRLSHWLDYTTSREALIEYFMTLGRTRFLEQIPLSQVLHGLVLMRRVLALFMEDRGVTTSDLLAMHQFLELTNRVLVFFDRGMFYAAYGYEEATREALGAAQGGDTDALAKVRHAFEHDAPWELVRRGLTDLP